MGCYEPPPEPIDTGTTWRCAQRADDLEEIDILKRVMLEVADELAPPGEWLEGEDQRARLARRLREAARQSELLLRENRNGSNA